MHTWWPRAACNGDPRFNMFPDHNDRAAITYAQGVCAVCPVRAACLRHGLATVETTENGMWGGLLREERRELRRRLAHEPWHGTLAGYCRHRCRCVLCADAYRTYDRGRAGRNLRKMARYRRNKAARRREIVSVTNIPGQETTT